MIDYCNSRLIFYATTSNNISAGAIKLMATISPQLLLVLNHIFVLIRQPFLLIIHSVVMSRRVDWSHIPNLT
jgi:hypothetical protein